MVFGVIRVRPRHVNTTTVSRIFILAKDSKPLTPHPRDCCKWTLVMTERPFLRTTIHTEVRIVHFGRTHKSTWVLFINIDPRQVELSLYLAPRAKLGSKSISQRLFSCRLSPESDSQQLWPSEGPLEFASVEVTTWELDLAFNHLWHETTAGSPHHLSDLVPEGRHVATCGEVRVTILQSLVFHALEKLLWDREKVKDSLHCHSIKLPIHDWFGIFLKPVCYIRYKIHGSWDTGNIWRRIIAKDSDVALWEMVFKLLLWPLSSLVRGRC